MVILDTNIIIDHLRQKDLKDTILFRMIQKRTKEIFVLSIVSIQELYEGSSTKDVDREQMLLSTIAPLKILPYTYEIAKKAGEIARDENKYIEMPDAAIAATAIINGCKLATFNKKDFRGIKDLELLKLEAE